MSLLFVAILVVGLLVLGGLVIAAIILAAMRQNQARPPSDPASGEHVRRISREIEKINGMLAAGRISAGEAAELKLALESERREWTAGGAEFTRKRLTKSRDCILAGVCGGLAEWIGCDVTLLRIVYAVLTFFSAAFPGILLYLIMWIFMPPSEPTAPTQDK